MDSSSQPGEMTAAAAAAGSRRSHDLDCDAFTSEVIGALRTVHDPEIPVNIYDLGLIYRISINAPGFVEIDMTLTAPGCPVASEILGWVRTAVGCIEGVSEVNVNLVFDPPWDQARMSEEAKLELGLS